MPAESAKLIEQITNQSLKTSLPEFKPGDTVRVHARIIEGQKERIQIFEGIVLKRHKGNTASATFTVRKVSYNIGVERTFLLHSPRVEKIEVVARGETRRARLFHLRPLRGKAARVKSMLVEGQDEMPAAEAAAGTEAPAAAE